MNKELMIATLSTIIYLFGENDGVVKKIYLKNISRFRETFGQEDCLSVAINLVDNVLITFWQDANDTYTMTDYFCSLSEEHQTAIFNQVMAEYGTKFVI